MIEWLADTLLATGGLMALVLLVRRPVARWFGPGAAYALWLLPMIRMILPTLALPGFMRDVMPGIMTGQRVVTTVLASTSPAPAANLPAPPLQPIAATPVPIEPGILDQVPWMTTVIAIWLVGAVLFLVWRVVAYRRARAELLRSARVVAVSGQVRIVDTPAIAAPLAFGIIDKVVALPRGFLAEADSETSDFAIAHEMEHHAGNDLLALIVMQPLFALHWFNPIGWSAWRAVRADQEAFCDARVMAGRSRVERARYGQLIATMAGGTPLGLAAPMAGPLTGDKPIIQRLKALSAPEVTPVRRVLARSLFALAVAGIPATATISYAAIETADEPDETPSQPGAQTTSPDPARHAAASASAVEHHPSSPSAPGGSFPPVAPRAGITPSATVPQASVVVADDVGREDGALRQDAAQVHATAQLAEHEAVRAEREARRAMNLAPRVRESVSADGQRRTVSISDANGQAARTMVLDASCPADLHHRDGVTICTGEPRAARLAAVNAIRASRASIAAQRDMGASLRAEILRELDSEIAAATSNAAGETD